MQAKELTGRHPREVRQLIREGRWTRPTSGLCLGHAQANMAILPRDLAFDFLLFAQRNPKPCPLLEVLDPGSPEPRRIAPGADIRTDLPKYRVYRYGVLEDEPTDIRTYWRDDFVTFLIGCSFTFEAGLVQAGVPVRHMELDRNVSMYITNIACEPAGIFHGPMVVSMRPIPAAQVAKAVQVSGRYPSVHGAPVHIGSPETLGVKDIQKPDFGDITVFKPGEVPVFWACGVTPQTVAMTVKPELMISHCPGHMFLTDVPNESLAVV
jgi:uncharacterized protein YcsI (UPF0317 family)